MVTPTQFIRAAALRSGVISLSMGKSVEYHDVDLVTVEDAKCYLCGGDTDGMGRTVAKAILPTFTDRDKARMPHSKSICAGCAFCLSFREMRNYSIVATVDRLHHPDRITLRQYLLDPPESPFVICITVSGQKWVHFKSMISYNRDYYAVQMEDMRVMVDRSALPGLLHLVEQMYAVFTKDEIITGRYNQKRVKDFGLAKFQELESRIAVYRGQRLFDLAVFVAQKPPEEETKEEKPCRKHGAKTTVVVSNAEQQPSLF